MHLSATSFNLTWTIFPESTDKLYTVRRKIVEKRKENEKHTCIASWCEYDERDEKMVASAKEKK